MFQIVRIVFPLALAFAMANSYQILAVFTSRAKSHGFAFTVLLQALQQRGHNVTLFSYFDYRIPGVVPVLFQPPITEHSELLTIDEFMSGTKLPHSLNHLLLRREFDNITDSFYSDVFKSEVFRKFSDNGVGKFDVMLLEFFYGDCLAFLSKKFNVPIVGLSSSTLLSLTNKRLGNPNNPAYVPNNALYFSDRMTFLERLENTIFTIIQDYVLSQWRLMRDELLIAQYFPAGQHILKEVIANNVSVTLVNSHWSLNGPRPMVPGVIEVAGVHLNTTRKRNAVPEKKYKNIERWLNEAREGVIFFSMGSMIKGHTFPADKRQAFLKAFSRFPEHRVLWKWENDTMDGERQPLPNVMLQRWMPQFDILCHPNVKAFISHGGLLSTIEAVHCGVPVVIMPQFGDQFTNARALEANGGGLTLHLADADESSIYDALLAALSPKLQLSSHQLSERFRDRPLPPLDTAIYWVEYVARHKGAYHMRTAAVNMPLYQYLLLDVLAFVIVVFMIISIVCIYITKWLWRKIFASREQNTKKKSS